MKEIQIDISIRGRCKDDDELKEMLHDVPTMAQQFLDEDDDEDVLEVKVTTKTRDEGAQLWNAGPSSEATRRVD